MIWQCVIGSEGQRNLAVVQTLNEMHQIEAQGVVINRIVYALVSVKKVLQNFTLGCVVKRLFYPVSIEKSGLSKSVCMTLIYNFPLVVRYANFR